MSDDLMHYGTPRHSGRYPWGSGENPYQRNKNFIAYVNDLKKKGLTEVQIARGMDMTTKQLRAKYSIAKDEKRMDDAAMAARLKAKGYSNVAIGKRMGINESSVRSLLDPSIQKRAEATTATAKVLEENVKKKGYIDVGTGTENYLGVSKDKLDTSIEMLKEKGYKVHNIKTEQLGTGQFTTIKVLCPPGTTLKEVSQNRDKIGSIAEWSNDGGYTYETLQKPKSISSERVMVRYGSEGGKDKDGVIELRRGVDDISLGNATYAQVRIAVDDSHYLKGMAVYSDNMPKGVDIIFNTNKDGVSKLDAMKPLKANKTTGEIDWDNPFGASIKRQQKYIDKDGKEKLSSINIVNEEGDWENWKKSLSTQMLSKQQPALAQKQLTLAYEAKKSQYDEISSLTNPVVRKKLLESFADSCDASAVHMEAAALPRQASHVILPIPSLKDNEIYAPRYKDGEKVVLIRYPHGGKFEIPELTVNNRNKEAKGVITNQAKDAVGINSKVAERLSGADFDGDTVLVIPNKKGPLAIKTSPPLDGLKDFDPKASYPAYEGMPKMSSRTKGIEMGKVSNLITDMTIKGANDDEIARAVRHSMVVIDAEKHHLNYKQSYIDNNIKELNEKYQGKPGGGASTLISRSTAEQRVPTRREYIDKQTGEKIYTPKNDTYIDKKGNVVVRTTTSTKGAEAKSAFELSSGFPIEVIYAKHSDKLRDLANQARKQAVNTQAPQASPSAKKTYANEVSSLLSKLNLAQKNAPLERQAQLLANAEVRAKKEADPNMDNDDLKKIKNQALTRARARVGANKKEVMINITDKEWEAVQAGAVSKTTLSKILNNTDEDRVKQLAMPKDKPTMTSARVSRAKSMLAKGCTIAEVAEALGVSPSTISRAVG